MSKERPTLICVPLIVDKTLPLEIAILRRDPCSNSSSLRFPASGEVIRLRDGFPRSSSLVALSLPSRDVWSGEVFSFFNNLLVAS